MRPPNLQLNQNLAEGRVAIGDFRAAWVTRGSREIVRQSFFADLEAATDKSLLPYSFADEHINAYIAQGLKGNPNASCLAMFFNDRSSAPKAVALAKKHANLTVVAADGGIVGTVDRSWDSTTQDGKRATRPGIVDAEPGDLDPLRLDHLLNLLLAACHVPSCDG